MCCSLSCAWKRRLLRSVSCRSVLSDFSAAFAPCRTYAALRAVLLRQLGTVTASGASFTAVMRRLQGGDQQATADSHMRPAYKKVACAAQQLRGALRAFQQ